jgi:hypothetical protein
MKPQTEALLQQCRIVLLQRSDEQLDTLLKSWFESMIGEESMDEILDDLCLLLNYRVRTWGTQTSYGTYTAWWEVEGSFVLEEGEGTGEFFCANVASLLQKLLVIYLRRDANCAARQGVCRFDNSWYVVRDGQGPRPLKGDGLV